MNDGAEHSAICSICLDEAPDCFTRCEHAFHFECIVKWTDKQAHCPVCRCEFTPTDVRYLYLTGGTPSTVPSVTYVQVINMVKEVMEYLRHVRGTMISCYTRQYAWSSLTRQWERRTDGHRTTAITTPALQPLIVARKHCKFPLRSAHVLTAQHIGDVHLDERMLLELRVECGMWYVRPRLCDSRSEQTFVVHKPCSTAAYEACIGPLVPSFWEGRDNEDEMERACDHVGHAFFQWLCAEFKCETFGLYRRHLEASIDPSSN